MGSLLASPPLRAALVLAGLLLVFFWTPLTQGGYYSAADLLQDSELLRVAPAGYFPKNFVVADPVKQMHPSLEWNRRQLWRGELPLWNPYNAWGIPHLANYQSAVFSVFSLPFYVLDFRHALLAAAALKLFALGYFTYLFLRCVGLCQIAALIGAVAFMFGSQSVLWLHFASGGGAIALPAGLYFAELALRADEADTRRRGLALVGFALALTAGLLTGQPERIFFSLLLLPPYVLFRLLSLGGSRRRAARRLSEFALAGAAALGLAAVQLLPFAEYVRHSATFATRDASFKVDTLAPELVPLQAFPNLLGSPALSYYDRALRGIINYNEANSDYVGLLVLFLAGLAVLTLPRHRSPLVAFFAGVGLVWLLYAYNIGGVGGWVGTLPIFKVAAMRRSHALWVFSVSCLAALGFHLLAQGRMDPVRWAPRRLAPAALIAALWAAALLLGALAGAAALLRWAAGQPDNAVGTPGPRELVAGHVAYLVATFLAGSVAVVVCARRPGLGRALSLAGGALVLLVFAQSGFLLRDYNPTIEDAHFYPVSPALEAITRVAGAEQTLRVDRAPMPANSNLWYELRSPVNYDSLGVAGYVRLHHALLRSPFWLETANPASLRALQLLGIQYVTTARPYPFAERVDRGAGQSQERTSRPSLSTDPITPSRPVSQTFEASAPNLTAVALRFDAARGTGDCTLVLRLEDVAAGRVVAQSSTECSGVRQNPEYHFTFPQQPNSAGRSYRLVITTPDATSDRRIVARYAPGGADGEELRVGDRSVDGRLALEAYASAIPALERVVTHGKISLFRVPNSLPRFFSVGSAASVHGDEDAIRLLQAPEFDPSASVVLHDGQPGPTTAATVGGQMVRVLDESPTRLRLLAERDTPGWLVALQTFYPGWVARVNGHSTDVLRANVAFSAVPIEAGVSEVVLAYEPASVKVGALVSAATAVGLLGATAILALRRPPGD